MPEGHRTAPAGVRPLAKRAPPPGPFRTALISTLPSLVLLVVAPANIYLGNQQHFDYRYPVVLDLCAVHAGMIALFYCLFTLFPMVRRPIAYPLAMVGVLAGCAYAFASVPMSSLLAGGTLVREPSLGSTLVDLAPLGALWVVARLVPTNLLVDISAVFVALVSATVPAAVLVEANASGGHLDRWEQRAQAPPQPGTDSINVYHLVFDGFEGALFRRIIGGFDLESRLGGFVFYENTYSNYTATSRSFPSFMTGRLFDAQTAEERVGEIGRSEGLVKTLAEHGYTVSQYNAYFINHHQRAHRRRSVTEIERRLYGDLRHLGELLDLSVLVSTPVAIKPLVIRDGTGPAGRWLRLTGQGIADWSRNPPLLSHMLAEQMLAEEADRPARGQYVLAHLLLPHAPFSLATDCEYQSRRRSTYVNLIEQTTCAVRIVVDLVEVLREHDRFRDALIVVHSDHGNLQKDRPLLLVKYPGRAGQPLETARHVVQLIDVAPTILEVLDLADPELPGVVLWNDTPHVRQEIQVWVSQP